MLRHVDVRRRRVRRGQRRPADLRRGQGAQVGLRRGRGRAELLPQPAAARPGLLDQVRHGPGRRTPTELNPVNQAWNGAGTDPRRWRRLPQTTDEYTIELLPGAPARPACDADEAGVVRGHDHRHVQGPGHRALAQGRQAQAHDHRHVPARQLPQLRLLHRLREPRSRRRAGLERRARTSRTTAPTATAPPATGKTCPEIQFASGGLDQRPAAHQRREPADLRHADVRAHARTRTAARGRPRPTRSRSAAAARATSPIRPAAAAATRRRSTRRPARSRPTSKRLALPESNAALEQVAINSSSHYKGKTLHPPARHGDGHHQRRRPRRRTSRGRPAA